MELKPGQQLFVNSKWYFDVKSIENQQVKLRIKYKESTRGGDPIYKLITIKQELLKDLVEKNGTVYCKIDEKQLRKDFGGLIDRIVKEKDVNTIFEDVAMASGANTAGMGNVSMATLSGTPGVPGGAGSGDIFSSALKPSTKMGPVIKKGTYGLSDLHKNIKTLRKLAKKGKNNKMGIKTPLLDVFKENASQQAETDNDFKRKLYEFLDYPWEKDIELKMITEMNVWRADFTNSSAQRIKTYFNDFYTMNESLIKKECTDSFINNVMILAGR